MLNCVLVQLPQYIRVWARLRTLYCGYARRGFEIVRSFSVALTASTKLVGSCISEKQGLTVVNRATVSMKRWWTWLTTLKRFTLLLILRHVIKRHFARICAVHIVGYIQNGTSTEPQSWTVYYEINFVRKTQQKQNKYNAHFVILSSLTILTVYSLERSF